MVGRRLGRARMLILGRGIELVIVRVVGREGNGRYMHSGALRNYKSMG